MPNRILRDWTDSEVINSLTPQEEVFFVRLIMKVDDFGRFSANPKLLNSLLFPLSGNMKNSDVVNILSNLINKGLIVVYEDGGKLFLELVKFGNTPRAKESKFPAPSEHLQANDFMLRANDFTLRANAPVTVTVTETKTGTESTSPRGEEFDRFWNSYPKKTGKQNAIREWNKARPDIVKVLQALEEQKEWRESAGADEFIPEWKDPERWIKAGCWMDVVTTQESEDSWAKFPRA
jgi:hypothetical protein